MSNVTKLKLSKPTFTLILSILVAAEVYLLPLLPDSLKPYSGFLGAVIMAVIIWVSTEGGVPVPPTTQPPTPP